MALKPAHSSLIIRNVTVCISCKKMLWCVAWWPLEQYFWIMPFVTKIHDVKHLLSNFFISLWVSSSVALKWVCETFIAKQHFGTFSYLWNKRTKEHFVYKHTSLILNVLRTCDRLTEIWNLYSGCSCDLWKHSNKVSVIIFVALEEQSLHALIHRIHLNNDWFVLFWFFSILVFKPVERF